MASGRKSAYETLIAPKLEKVCEQIEQNEMDDEAIAQAFGISRSTLYKYKAQKKEFADALARARDVFNQNATVRVKLSLLKKACGYEYEEKKSTMKKDKFGENVIYVEKFQRHCPPSETAARMWLQNHDPTFKDCDDATAKIRKAELELKQKLAESKTFDFGEFE